MRTVLIALIAAIFYSPALAGESPQVLKKHEIGVSGTTFTLDGTHFPYTGIGFFNAIYNPAFNKGPQERRQWLAKFTKYGINVLRIWCQWDCGRGFADGAPDHTMYFPDGRLRQAYVDRLKEILLDADQEGFVVELCLFCQESWHENIRLGPAESEKAISSLTHELMPYRNVTFQIWNEFSERIIDHVKTVKDIDKKRLVTNAPGFSGFLGDSAQNQVLDYLTPHTSRQNAGKHWEIAPKEIAYLLARYKKPVVDDEPARCGTSKYGGPQGATSPFDHIVQIQQVWNIGGYINYHHDMFQTGYNTPAVPPSGIPDPEFSPYHRQVLEFIAQRERYMPKATSRQK